MKYFRSIMSMVIGLLVITVGCNDANITNQESKQLKQSQEVSQKTFKHQAQNYEVTFKALNPDAGYKKVMGVARLKTKGDNLTVKVNAQGLQPGMIHPQHIHTAGSCPDMSADANGDGFIDVVEGVPSYGGIFISLDADLSDLSFQTSFPKPTNKAGAITYRESASIAELENATGESLNLEGRHLVLHGVSPDTDLPESVQSLGGLPSYLTLPVACGEVTAVN